MDSTTESVEQKSAVLSALAKENEKVSEYRKKAQKNLSEVMNLILMHGPLVHETMLKFIAWCLLGEQSLG